MSEQPQNNPEYLQHHPDAVQDIDRAHNQANKSNTLRSEAAFVRSAGQFLIDAVADANYQYVGDEVNTDPNEYVPYISNETKKKLIATELANTPIVDPKDKGAHADIRKNYPNRRTKKAHDRAYAKWSADDNERREAMANDPDLIKDINISRELKSVMPVERVHGFRKNKYVTDNEGVERVEVVIPDISYENIEPALDKLAEESKKIDIRASKREEFADLQYDKSLELSDKFKS